MSIDPHVALSRLRWRCRRGMRELDQLTLRYLEHRYPVAETDERGNFEALLELEDDQIWRWLMGREQPSPEFDRVVSIILSLPP